MPHAVSTAPRTRGFRVLRWMLVLALAAGFTGAGAVQGALAAPAAPAEDNTVSWSARPADTAQGSARPNFAYDLLPGSTVEDGILVTNRGAAPITLDIYAADGFLTADGSLDILARAEASTELGSWISLSSDAVTLEGGQSAEIPFEITVPSTIQPGDYSAGVVAAMSVESDTGVITERRLGSRMHVRIEGEITPSLALTDVRIDYEGTLNPFAPGAATVTFTLANTGNARIAPSGSLDVSGLFGLAAASVSLSDIPELLPGSTLERTVEVDGVAPLFFTTADLTVGGEVVQRPGSAATDSLTVAAVVASASTWTVPWVALAIFVLVVGIIVWWLVARRRGKAKHQREVDEAVAAALAARETEGAATTQDAATEPAVERS